MEGQAAIIKEMMMAASNRNVNAATLRVSQQNMRSGVAECSTRFGDAALDAVRAPRAPMDWATSAVGSDAMRNS
jgi:hypothetical protein